ncbi:MAG TPA: hypothetical protein VEI03_05095 [Stellaceae bacterium]|nr:hypothetical protein [Stellaceae bacterium]
MPSTADLTEIPPGRAAPRGAPFPLHHLYRNDFKSLSILNAPWAFLCAIAAAALPRAGGEPRRISWLDLRQPQPHPAVRPSTGWQRRIGMLDAIMLAIGIAFFALCIGYVVACEKL